MKMRHLIKEEIKDTGLPVSANFKGGLCRCKVISASDETSSAGNEMIVLTIKVLDSEREHATIKEYLTSTESSLGKIKNFCEATKMVDEWYEDTLSAAVCTGKTFEAQVGIKKSNDERYPDKWAIKYFIAADKYETFKDGKKPSQPTSSPIEEDDIPF